MAQSKAHQRASNKYNAKAYDRININVKKGKRDILKNYAEAQGMSLNAYINKLIAEDMGEEWLQEQPKNLTTRHAYDKIKARRAVRVTRSALMCQAAAVELSAA